MIVGGGMSTVFEVDGGTGVARASDIVLLLLFCSEVRKIEDKSASRQIRFFELDAYVNLGDALCHSKQLWRAT